LLRAEASTSSTSYGYAWHCEQHLPLLLLCFCNCLFCSSEIFACRQLPGLKLQHACLQLCLLLAQALPSGRNSDRHARAVLALQSQLGQPQARIVLEAQTAAQLHAAGLQEQQHVAAAADELRQQLAASESKRAAAEARAAGLQEQVLQLQQQLAETQAKQQIADQLVRNSSVPQVQQGEQLQPQHTEQQQQKRQRLRQEPMVRSIAPASAAAAGGLGPAGLALVKQELGALPSQQQLQYWQLADRPFDAADLQQLVSHYLLPGQAATLAGRANRSGRARPALVQVPDRLQRHYPMLAPSLHGLLAQLQQQQQQQQATGSNIKHSGKRKAADLAGSFAESPAAVVLLRALRCLQLWESRQVTQPDMPTLLQRLAGVGGGAAAAAGGDGAGDVEEVVDLTADDDGVAGGSGHTAAAAGESESDVMQAFVAGQIDVLLVREQQSRQGGSSCAAAPAHAVRVKDELEY
jgi:hypothetical protein